MITSAIPAGIIWSCAQCGCEYETPARSVPVDDVCSECKRGGPAPGCSLPDGWTCSSGWHGYTDENGYWMATERCHRRLQAVREQRTASELQRAKITKGFKEFDRAHQSSMFKAAWRWANGCEGLDTIALLGPTGTGKSHLLMASRYYLIKRGLATSWVTPEDLTMAVNAFRSMGNKIDKWLPRYERWCECDVLILEDLGHEQSPAEETAGFLNGIADQRGERPLGFATNFDRKQLEDRYGAPTASRLFHGATVPDVRPTDYRSTRP